MNKIKEKPFELWQLLKEVSTGSKETSKIEKIENDGKPITDPCEISNQFVPSWPTNF
jgi:hypothetical protein